MSRRATQPGRDARRAGPPQGPGRRGWLPLTLFVAAALACACVSERPRPLRPSEDLHDPNPALRAQAASEAGRVGALELVPALIELLDDDDATVRLTAGRSLADLTGRDSGYRPYAEPAELRRQVEDWRAWWRAQPPRSAKGRS